jgi:hypothetical protein
VTDFAFSGVRGTPEIVDRGVTWVNDFSAASAIGRMPPIIDQPEQRPDFASLSNLPKPLQIAPTGTLSSCFTKLHQRECIIPGE